MYKVPGDTPLAPFFARKGDPERSLFYPALRGLLSPTWQEKQERITKLFLDPGSTIVNIFYHLWLVIVILKVSISSSPAFLYCIMCTCICFMLFRSTCLWPFSEENPLRVASEALNIHLVSCIL